MRNNRQAGGKPGSIRRNATENSVSAYRKSLEYSDILSLHMEKRWGKIGKALAFPVSRWYIFLA
jgi:hypothetical protein